jgi:hypothetical protein
MAMLSTLRRRTTTDDLEQQKELTDEPQKTLHVTKEPFNGLDALCSTRRRTQKCTYFRFISNSLGNC